MLPVFDGHNDTLLNLYLPTRGKGRSFFTRSDTGHIDLPRAREGGFGGGFFAVFVPSPSVAGEPDKNLIASPTGYEVRLSPPSRACSCAGGGYRDDGAAIPAGKGVGGAATGGAHSR